MTWRLLVAAVAAAVTVAAIAFRPAEAETGPALIRVASAGEDFARIDLGRRGRGIGDFEIITQKLYNRRITRRPIGRVDGECVIGFGETRVCRITYTLPRGAIVVGGRIRFRQFFELAILGGTGLYNNARGTLTATQTRRSPRREFLIFRLTG
jgi:hypothetical protein